MARRVVPFFGKFDTFSNFFRCRLIIEGKCYSCTEQYYQSRKAALFGDWGTYRNIMSAVVQRDMKHLGAGVRHVNAEVWQAQRVPIMRRALDAKFRQHPALADVLLSTGNSYLVEANPSDSFWGIGMAKTDQDIGNVDCHRGANVMGLLLMDLRSQLQSERSAAAAVVPSGVPRSIGTLGRAGLSFGRARPGVVTRRTRRGGKRHQRRLRCQAGRRLARLQGDRNPARLDFL